ncbi:hypothetical protein HOT99_gp140 [Caulobacter phage CcrBL10]|uniref:Uncharacterized protein n=1 Tax=Caulobacter phage CcrBL10 TaxID=2283269 RepID=A0A385ECD9_9CAUD|nr:hypothetical protein HOT99_gp140 [Caulobacter phage CcrBL10]AXQ68477.1 hypothetical protein CcrBL10_gp273 [Caulobacter phage CcrBL10]
MGAQLEIKEVFAASQDAVYSWRGEEGDEYRVMSLVHVQTMDGRWFLMPAMRPYSDVERFDFEMACEGEPLFGMAIVYWDAEAFAAKVRARGVIRPEFWVEYEPDTRTTEQRFEDMWIEEQYDRMGYAA